MAQFAIFIDVNKNMLFRETFGKFIIFNLFGKKFMIYKVLHTFQAFQDHCLSKHFLFIRLIMLSKVSTSFLRNHSQIARISKRNIWNWNIGWLFKPMPRSGTPEYWKRVRWCVPLATGLYLFVYANAHIYFDVPWDFCWNSDSRREWHKLRHDLLNKKFEDEKRAEFDELTKKRMDNLKLLEQKQNEV